MAKAPAAILKLDATLKKHPHKPKSYRFSGIVGDAAHSFGYHLAPNQLGSDYSLRTKRDKAGAKKYSNLASAWDLSFNESDMKKVTARLRAAARKHDPRVRGIREFAGTLNGNTTYNYDLSNGSEGFGQWDNSHLWHIHISFYRDVCNDFNALKGVLDVICGIPLPAAPKPAAPKPSGYIAPKFPLGKLDYFGVNKNNRGNNVLKIQHRLQKLGYASKAKGWADGLYGPETAVAIDKWKKAHKYKAINGKLGLLNWNRLFKKTSKD